MSEPAQDLPRGVETVDPRKVHVHQHEVGLQLGGHGHRVLAGFGFTHDVEAVGGIDDHARRHAERLLVIDDEDSDGHD